MKTISCLVLACACCCSSFAQNCCGEAKGDAFMEEAAKMMAASEGKDACCKSTEGHMVMKGETGCCSAKGEVAKFKVFVLGTGYKFFGCEDSAKKGRNDLAASGAKVGNVQKVRSRVVIN